MDDPNFYIQKWGSGPLSGRSLLLGCVLLVGTTAAVQGADPFDDWHWHSPLPQGNDLYAMTYANDRFVAVGDYGTIISSSDGESWNFYSLDLPLAFRGIAFGQGRFVAVGNPYGAIAG